MFYLFKYNKPVNTPISPKYHKLNNDVKKKYVEQDSIIYDSDMTLLQSLMGSKAPRDIISDLSLIYVDYYSFDFKIHRGQLLVNKRCEESLKAIFREIKLMRFPILAVVPIVMYDWNDSISMISNNSSGFNYRFVDGSKKLSKHADGFAVDINPLLNPYVNYKSVRPPTAVYDTAKLGTLSKNSAVVSIFKRHGWKWGGDWRKIKDYQHFYKE